MDPITLEDPSGCFRDSGCGLSRSRGHVSCGLGHVSPCKACDLMQDLLKDSAG